MKEQNKKFIVEVIAMITFIPIMLLAISSVLIEELTGIDLLYSILNGKITTYRELYLKR